MLKSICHFFNEPGAPDKILPYFPANARQMRCNFSGTRIKSSKRTKARRIVNQSSTVQMAHWDANDKIRQFASRSARPFVGISQNLQVRLNTVGDADCLEQHLPPARWPLRLCCSETMCRAKIRNTQKDCCPLQLIRRFPVADWQYEHS